MYFYCQAISFIQYRRREVYPTSNLAIPNPQTLLSKKYVNMYTMTFWKSLLSIRESIEWLVMTILTLLFLIINGHLAVIIYFMSVMFMSCPYSFRWDDPFSITFLRKRCNVCYILSLFIYINNSNRTASQGQYIELLSPNVIINNCIVMI